MKFSGSSYITTPEIATLGSSSCSHRIKILRNIKTRKAPWSWPDTHQVTKPAAGCKLHLWFLTGVVLGENNSSVTVCGDVQPNPLSAGHRVLKIKTSTKVPLLQLLSGKTKPSNCTPSFLASPPPQSEHGKNKTQPNKTKTPRAKQTRSGSDKADSDPSWSDGPAGWKSGVSSPLPPVLLLITSLTNLQITPSHS